MGVVPIVAGGVQQVLVDASGQPWQVVAGDVYFLVYDYPSAPPANPQDAMASIG